MHLGQSRLAGKVILIINKMKVLCVNLGDFHFDMGEVENTWRSSGPTPPF